MPTLWLHCLLAHSFLCIMGSSAPVERSFNKCGQALRDSRNRLDPEVVSDLVFCAENLAFVRGTGEWSSTCASSGAGITSNSSSNSNNNSSSGSNSNNNSSSSSNNNNNSIMQ